MPTRTTSPDGLAARESNDCDTKRPPLGSCDARAGVLCRAVRPRQQPFSDQLTDGGRGLLGADDVEGPGDLEAGL